jgi:DNA-cytosine methyltransferase
MFKKIIKMNVLSLFDGISCGQIALNKVGVNIENYYASEIKDYAIKVTQENYPKTIQLGDVTKIKASDLPKIDLLIGGSPCQDFSQANRTRKGVEGSKSGLFYEYVRLLKELNPKYFLLENVKMKKEHEELINEELGCTPIKINSEIVSPQLRNRLYWTNIPVNLDIERVDVYLNDILEEGFSDREKSRALLESDSRPLKSPIKMCHRYFNKGFNTIIFKSHEHYSNIIKHFNKHFKGKTAKEIDLLIPSMDLSLYEGVRHMRKSERESCQTVPNGYTKCLTENEAACVLGDGWTVDVIAHIFKGLKK